MLQIIHRGWIRGAGRRFKTLLLDLKINMSFYSKEESMNLNKLYAWVIGVVFLFVATGRRELLQSWIWKAQAKVIYESRSSAWGSPRFFRLNSSLSYGLRKIISDFF